MGSHSQMPSRSSRSFSGDPDERLSAVVEFLFVVETSKNKVFFLRSGRPMFPTKTHRYQTIAFYTQQDKHQTQGGQIEEEPPLEIIHRTLAWRDAGIASSNLPHQFFGIVWSLSYVWTWATIRARWFIPSLTEDGLGKGPRENELPFRNLE